MKRKLFVLVQMCSHNLGKNFMGIAHNLTCLQDIALGKDFCVGVDRKVCDYRLFNIVCMLKFML